MMMPRKPHLHFHSDCDFFAGCENMLANFFADARLQENFEISFSYRYTPAYQDGLRQRVPSLPSMFALPLISEASSGQWARKWPPPLSYIFRLMYALIGLRYWIMLLNVWKLCFAWKGRKIDLLHINNGGYPGASSARAAIIAARILGIQHVVMVVNNIAVPPRIHERPFEYLISCLFRRWVSAFITGSHFASKALQERIGGKKALFLGLHNGIGSRQPSETTQHTRNRLGIHASELVFGIVALLESRKGHRVLFHAVAEMNRHLPNEIRPLILVEGHGPEEADLRDLVTRLGLDKQIRFIGQEQNIFNFIQCIDLLLVPSIDYEDFPNVVLEAMSLGKPVIASSLAGIPEQVNDKVSGWLVAPGDIGQLSRAMLNIVHHRALIHEAGKSASVRFNQFFRADIAVSRYLNLYHLLLEMKEKK